MEGRLQLLLCNIYSNQASCVHFPMSKARQVEQNYYTLYSNLVKLRASEFGLPEHIMAEAGALCKMDKLNILRFCIKIHAGEVMTQ
jgi:hypothetical protein